jgi:cytochrome P450
MALTGIAVPDLVDPTTYAGRDMADVWRRLRAGDPVYWYAATTDRPGFWVLTRHADIAAVLRDAERFTSERGNVLDTLLRGGDTGAGRMLAVADGAYHTDLRKVLQQAFAPRVLASVVWRVRRTTKRLLLRAVERGECDFAADIASAIPLETICNLLDVPAADRADVLRLTKSALASDYAEPGADVDRMARNEILVYFHELVEDRRRSPGEDPISLMAAGEVAGRRLSDVDIVLNCYSLIMGGDETSRLAMIGAVREFAANDVQWAALRDGDVSVESAGEEVLRWTTPTMHFGRTATTRVTLHDTTIAAGDIVTLWLTSANRDEDVFANADRFDLGRSPNRHLALGHGPHFCLGAYLGRVEIHAMLDGLRTFVRRIEQAGPERWIYSNFLSGMSSLPIALDGDPGGSAKWSE